MYLYTSHSLDLHAHATSFSLPVTDGDLAVNNADFNLTSITMFTRDVEG